MSESNSNNQQQSGGGLSKSTPLVTVSNVHSGVRTAVTPAGTDHPLATPSVELPERPAAPAPVSPPPPPKAPIAPTVVPVSPPTVKKQATSLEDMADEFLSEPSTRTEAGLGALLKPVPLPKGEQGIQRMRTLVTRRAWGDVLQVCGTMLRGPASPYTQVYASLISDSKVDVPDNVKQETMEILTLECHAWLKLRRYNELGREVDRWNFLSHNDSNAASPSWVPWSLRK